MELNDDVIEVLSVVEIDECSQPTKFPEVYVSIASLTTSTSILHLLGSNTSEPALHVASNVTRPNENSFTNAFMANSSFVQFSSETRNAEYPLTSFIDVQARPISSPSRQELAKVSSAASCRSHISTRTPSKVVPLASIHSSLPEFTVVIVLVIVLE